MLLNHYRKQTKLMTNTVDDRALSRTARSQAENCSGQRRVKLSRHVSGTALVKADSSVKQFPVIVIIFF